MAKLVMVGFWADYEQFFFESASLVDNRFKVINLADSFWRPSKLKAALNKVINTNVTVDSYTTLLKKHCQEDDILIFQEEGRCLDVVAKLKDHFKCGILCRNPVDIRPAIKEKLINLKTLGIPIWSFDPGDCKTYGLHLHRQFISEMKINSTINQSYDLVFIGRDKGRSGLLNTIEESMRLRGYKTLIDIRGKTKQGKQKPSSYNEYLLNILQGKCLIDIVQEKQQGLTLRPLEALIYGRKLISNNPEIALMEFYHPDNIFVFSESVDPAALSHFLERPMTIINESIIRKFITENVLTEILCGFE